MSGPWEDYAPAPRGIRNNNPGNIEDGAFARSHPGYSGSDGRFAVFDTPEAGAGAQAKLLQSYGKRGINTVEGIVNRWAPPKENDTGAYVRFVAQRAGLDPRAPLNMDDPAVVSRIQTAMAEHENGQPVTQTESPPWADYAPAPAARKAMPQKAAAAPKPAPLVPQKAAPKPSTAELAASGFMQPFRDLGNMVTARQEKLTARAKAPPAFSLPGFAQGLIDDVGDSARMVGGMMGLASAPAQAAIRPTAAAINSTVGGPTVAPRPQIGPNGVSFTAPRQLQGAEAQAALEGQLNAALSAARPATMKTNIPAPKPMGLEDLQAASDAAWRKVDASGYRFPQKDVQGAASDIRKLVNDAGPELYPDASRIADRVEALAKRGDLTPAQANRLRSQVGEKLLQPGSTEASLGAEIKSRIDTLIDTANDPSLATARDLYTRLSKMKDVTRRIESGELAQETAGTGGNQNAIRQKLRPTIDPKSPQRIRNLTKEETAAVRKVVKGTGAQNALRLLTAFDPTAGKLQALLSTGAAGLSGGTSLAMMPVGMAAKVGESAIAKKSIQNLLDLISIGGTAARTPGPSVLGPFAPLTGPSRLLGAGVVGGPLLRTQVERPRTKASAKSATSSRRK